jgi:hypothetical protein
MEPVLVSKRDSPIGWRDRGRYSRLLSRAFDLLLFVVVSESGEVKGFVEFLALHTNHLLDLGDYFNQIFLVLHHRFD